MECNLPLKWWSQDLNPGLGTSSPFPWVSGCGPSQASTQPAAPGPVPANSIMLRTNCLPSIRLRCFKAIISFNPHNNLAKKKKKDISVPFGETGLWDNWMKTDSLNYQGFLWKFQLHACSRSRGHQTILRI